MLRRRFHNGQHGTNWYEIHHGLRGVMGDTTVTRHALGGLLRRFRPGRRLRVERTPRVDALDEGEAVPARESSPTSYRTFSRKLAPALTAFGGALALAGGLGEWVRATKLEAVGGTPEEVATIWGYSDWPGIAIAALGALAIAGAATWLMSMRIIKLLPILYSIAVIALVAWQLPLVNNEAAGLAATARGELDFVTFHAGYGWGAWLMLAGAVLLFLGSTAGILRELDVRRGSSR